MWVELWFFCLLIWICLIRIFSIKFEYVSHIFLKIEVLFCWSMYSLDHHASLHNPIQFFLWKTFSVRFYYISSKHFLKFCNVVVSCASFCEDIAVIFCISMFLCYIGWQFASCMLQVSKRGFFLIRLHFSSKFSFVIVVYSYEIPYYVKLFEALVSLFSFVCRLSTGIHSITLHPSHLPYQSVIFSIFIPSAYTFFF